MTEVERELMEVELELIRIDLIITRALGQRPIREAQPAAYPLSSYPDHEASAPLPAHNVDQGG